MALCQLSQQPDLSRRIRCTLICRKNSRPSSAAHYRRSPQEKSQTHSSRRCQQLSRLRSLADLRKRGPRQQFRDLDGNEYIDHNLTFGALMAGHCHPAVMKAVNA